MKLTDTHREAFVASVMQDVPETDYGAPFCAMVLTDMIASAPPEISAVLKNEALRHFVLNPHDAVRSTPPAACGIKGIPYYEVRFSTAAYSGYEFSAECEEQVKELVRKASEQYLQREALEAKLEASIAACTTLKIAHEMLPEFKKYFPEEQVKSSMLPAIAGLTADLIQMGWPDGGKKVGAKAEEVAA